MRKSLLRHFIITITFCSIICANSHAQVLITDNFEDGNITSAPVWINDTGNFLDNNTAPNLAGTRSLRSSTTNAVKNIRFAYVAAGNLSGTSTTWRFLFRNNGGADAANINAPATGNASWRYWLASNGTTTSTAGGYALIHKVNQLLLVRFTSGNVIATTLATYTFGTYGTNIYSIKVTRSPTGTWTLYANTGTADPTTSTGSGTDATLFNSGSSAIYTILEANDNASANRYVWDNVSIIGGYDWLGGSTTNFATAANWDGGFAPGATDYARISVNTALNITNQPTISATTTLAGLILGTDQEVTLTVNSPLTVNGSIVQNTNFNVGGGVVWLNTIAGSAAITANAFDIGTSTSVNGSATIGTSSSAALAATIWTNTSTNSVINGDITLYGILPAGNTSYASSGPSFFELQAGKITADRIVTINQAGAYSSFALDLSGVLGAFDSRLAPYGTGTVKLFGDGTTGGTFVLSGTGTNQILLTTSPANTNTTVEYGSSAAVAQSVATVLPLASSPTLANLYDNIAFTGTSTKTVQAGTLNINGTFTSTGTQTVDFSTNNPDAIIAGDFSNASGTVINGGTGTFSFTKTTAQAINNANTTAGSVTLNNVNISGNATKTIGGAGSGITVANTGVLTLSGTTTVLDAGTAKLTLKSGSASSASVAIIPSPGTAGNRIAGTVNVERYFTGGVVGTQRAYRLLGFPVNNSGTIAQTTATTAYYNFGGVSTYLFTGGPSGTSAGFTVTNPGASTVFLYRENTKPSTGTFNGGNYRGLAMLGVNPFQIVNQGGTYSLYSGGGAMVYYVGSYSGGAYATKPFPNPDNAVAVYTGTLNQGPIPVRLWYNPSVVTFTANASPAGDDGYALLGNPYACTIDWEQFSTTASGAGIYAPNVSNTVYQYDYSAKRYKSYQVGGTFTGNATQYLGSGQGFFVKAITSAATVTFNEAAKASTKQPAAGKLLLGIPVANKPKQLLRVKFAQDTINQDDIAIVFEPDAKNEYEPINDADHLKGIGQLASLSSYPSDTAFQLSINHMHSIDSLSRIKLNVSGSSTSTDTLSASGFESLDQRYDVYLVDHFKNDSVVISKTKSYQFTINPADSTTFGDKRFEIAFHKNLAYATYKLINFAGKKSGKNVQLTWTTANEQNATGFTLQRADESQKLLSFKSLNSQQSTGKGTYTYTDTAPLKGVNSYRLLQNDAFEQISYSEIVSVNPSVIDFDPIKLFPNPVINQLQIKLDLDNLPAQVHLTLLNSTGKLFISKDVSSSNVVQNVGYLQPGTYIIELSNPTTKKVIALKKFIKI